MAGGKAVVAADTDGPRLMIEDGVDGVLVEPGDTEAMSTAVGRLLDDDATRLALGAAAARAAARYDIGDMVRRFEDLWDAVLAEAAPQGATARRRKGIRRRRRT